MAKRQMQDAIFQPQAAPTDKFVTHGLRIEGSGTTDTLGQFARGILGSQKAVAQIGEREIREHNKAEEARADQLAAELSRMDAENITRIAEDHYEDVNSAVFNNRLAARTAQIASDQYQRALVRSFADNPIDHNDPSGFSNRVNEIRGQFLEGVNPYFETVFLQSAAPKESAAFNTYESVRASYMREQAETAVSSSFGTTLDRLAAPDLTPEQRGEVLEDLRGMLQAEFNNGVTSNSANAKLYVEAVEAYALETGDTSIIDELADTRMFEDAPIGNTKQWQQMKKRILTGYEVKRDRDAARDAKEQKAYEDLLAQSVWEDLRAGRKPSPATIAILGPRYETILASHNRLLNAEVKANLQTPENQQFQLDFALARSNGTVTETLAEEAVNKGVITYDQFPDILAESRNNRDSIQQFQTNPLYNQKLSILKKAIVDSYTGDGSFVYNGHPYNGSEAEAQATQLYEANFRELHAGHLQANGLDHVAPDDMSKLGEEALQLTLNSIGIDKPITANLPSDAETHSFQAKVQDVRANQDDEGLLDFGNFPENAQKDNVLRGITGPSRMSRPLQRRYDASGLTPMKTWSGTNGEFELDYNDPIRTRARDELVEDILENGVGPGYINRLPTDVIRRIPADFQWFTTLHDLQSAMQAMETSKTPRLTAVGRIMNIHNLRGIEGYQAFIGMQAMRLHALDRNRESLTSEWGALPKKEQSKFNSDFLTDPLEHGIF